MSNVVNNKTWRLPNKQIHTDKSAGSLDKDGLIWINNNNSVNN